MPYGSAAQYRRWFEYEQDMHVAVLESLRAVPETKRSTEAFLKAVELMDHLALARRVWLYRLGVIQQGPTDFGQRAFTLADVTSELDRIQAEWSVYLERLTDADLERVFEYRSYDAGTFQNRVEDILAQLYGHSLYHRGQVAQLVRSLAEEPAATDFVFWTREAIDESQSRE